MKKRRRLAISIYLALNLAAVAGWHTNEPFVAWPATNHLRWVNGYTNAPVWTNAAYGGWTNNYWSTNLWIAPAFYNRANFPLPMFYGPSSGRMTNYCFNAKDVRALDCILAVAERMQAHGSGVNASNVWSYITHDYFGDATHDPTSDYEKMFFREERRAIQQLKAVIAHFLLDGSWVVMTNATGWVSLTEAMVCSNAAVPPNFLRYTPSRVADMTSTAYLRVLTNTWTLLTTNSGVVTNVFIDSFSESHALAGTNGQSFTLIVTNVNHAEGWPIMSYGWDGLKMVITNFSVTARGNTWGIGFGTNAATAYNGSYPLPLYAPAQINIAPVYNDAGDIDAIEGWNGWPGDAWSDPTYYRWIWALSNGSPMVKTNAAPEAEFSANFNIGCNAWAKYQHNKTRADLWQPASDSGYMYNDNSANHTSRWTQYAAPLRASTMGPVARELAMFCKTNGTSMLFWSTNLPVGSFGVTSPPYIIAVPDVPTAFGASNRPLTVSVQYGEYQSQQWPYDTMAWIDWRKYGGGSGSTNLTFPVVTSHATLERWQFEYR